MSIDFNNYFSYTQIMKKIFGGKLRNLRKENGEFQSDLAKEINVDISMISLWETGKNYPEVKKLIEIAEHYNVSIDYLLGRTENKNVNNNYNNYGIHNGDVNFK